MVSNIIILHEIFLQMYKWIFHIFFLIPYFCFAQIPNPWQTPDVVKINKLPARATAISYPSIELSKNTDRDASPYKHSLNGDWKFFWAESPNKVPAEFYKKEFNDTNWDRIPVPSNWELEGYGKPWQRLTPQIWEEKGVTIPNIPEDYNPTGSYRKLIDLPDDWKNKQITLHIGAASSVLRVWVNGNFVGYSENNRLPAEFDISPFLQSENNLIALQVLQWSDGSYIEDQDHWRMSGITREVFLEAAPKVQIFDFGVRTDLDEDFQDAKLQIRPEVKNYSTKDISNYSLEASLYNETGKNILDSALVLPVKKLVNEYYPQIGNRPFENLMERTIKNPLKWSAEEPNLYTLVLALKDEQGKLVEARSTKIGFREIDTKNGEFRVNGVPVLLYGVNRHDWDASTGKAVTPEAMRRDAELMKKLNVNASRSSHYPNPPYWYELCDEYGIYVMDEANIESHALGSLPSNLTDWHTAFMERGIRMVERDKNYPSIVSWSLGNEAGFGPNHAALSAWIKEFDPTRPIHYEGAQNIYGYRWPNPEPKDRIYTDIISRMYRLTEDMVALATQPGDDRPIIWCEYAHSQGNSTGDLEGYWEAIRKYHRLVGGFVWDWRDQLITKESPDAKTLWKHGADFGQKTEDLLPIQKGLISADGKIKSGGWQAKYVWQRAEFKAIDAQEGEFSIKNRFFRTNLDNYDLEWEITEDGKVIEKGTIPAPSVQPGNTETLKFDFPEIQFQIGKRYFVNLSLILKKDKKWAEKGYAVAYEQFYYGYLPGKEGKKITDKVNIEEYGEGLIVSTGGVNMKFDKVSGFLYEVKTNQNTLISGPLRPNFWRAPTDNDLASGMVQRQVYWKTLPDSLYLVGMESQISDNHAIIETLHRSHDDKVEIHMVYTISGDGAVDVEFKLVPSNILPDLPRIGLQTRMPKTYSELEWFGRGPLETYSDKKSGSLIGRYQTSVLEDFTYYVRPQESGNKTDVYWAKLINPKGEGLEFKSMEEPVNFSVWPFSMKNIEEAERIEDLEFSEEMTINIDLAQMGVGGDNTWSIDAAPHKDFRLPPQVYNYSFKIQPVK